MRQTWILLGLIGLVGAAILWMANDSGRDLEEMRMREPASLDGAHPSNRWMQNREALPGQ